MKSFLQYLYFATIFNDLHYIFVKIISIDNYDEKVVIKMRV